MPARSRLDSLVRLATALLLLAGIALFLRGWLHSDMGAKIPWEPAGAQRALLLSAVYWLVFVVIVATGRRALPAKFAAGAALALAAAADVVPVVAAAFLFLSGAALGFGILSRNRRVARDASDLPLCTATGLGILGSALAVLGLWPINTSLTWLVVLAFPLAWQGRAVLQLIATSLNAETSALRWPDLALAGLVGNLALFHVAVALLPEVGNDALAIHLLVASHVRDFGFWHYDVQRNVLAVTPLSVDFLYAAGYMYGGETAARLVNVATLLVALALVHVSVRAVGTLRHALLATLLAAASPLAALESATLFIDNAWALFVVASIVAFLQFAKHGEPVRLVVGGVLFGAALAAKAVAIAALPAALLLIALAWRERRADFPWRMLGVAVVAGLAVALPPYLIALAKTGNPVFPLFNAVFRSSLFPERNGIIYPGALDPLLLYQMTFYSDRHLEGRPGSLGFSFLLLLPALLTAAAVWGRRDGRAMLFAVLTFAAVVVANTAYLRYLYPCAFLFALAFGATLPALEARGALLGSVLKFVALASVAANAMFLTAGFGPIRSFDVPAMVEGRARAEYITKWAPTRHLVPLLNALPAHLGAVAFLGAPPYLAELRRTAYVDSAYMRSFLGKTAALANEADLLRLIREYDLGLLVTETRPDVPRVPAHIGLPFASAGAATLHVIAPQARFQVERLQGERLGVRPGAWVRHGDVPQEATSGAVVVNAANLFYQGVPIAAGATYLYTVEARCRGKAADIRPQVIWHLSDGRTQVYTRSVACSAEWTAIDDLVVAPADAVTAVVYASGDTNDPVEIRNVSFRSRN